MEKFRKASGEGAGPSCGGWVELDGLDHILFKDELITRGLGCFVVVVVVGFGCGGGWVELDGLDHLVRMS